MSQAMQANLLFAVGQAIFDAGHAGKATFCRRPRDPVSPSLLRDHMEISKVFLVYPSETGGGVRPTGNTKPEEKLEENRGELT